MSRTKSISAVGSLKSVFSLSLGTLIVQGLSAGGQFLLALWLAPSEFGYWAAAVSAMTVLTALTNFGEVNGFLSRANDSLRLARRNALKLNFLLSLLGLGISAFYFNVGNDAVSLYCLVIALTIPLNGEADLSIAAGVYLKKFSSIVSSQAVAAMLKFLLSVLVAFYLESAVALAASATLYYLVVCVLLRKTVLKAQELDGESSQIDFRRRAEWAVNSYFMTFPVQAIFLSAQFFVAPAELGLLYIGFQVTLALSGLLSVPLNRIVLSSLSSLETSERGKFVATLSCAISIIVTVVSALLSLLLAIFREFLPTDWQIAIPIAAAFLVAMPMRILSPIIEARQQVEKKWIQATLFNVFESLGSILIVLIVSSLEDLVLLALAISFWKILFGVIRTLFVLRGEKALVSLLASLFSVIGAGLLGLGVFEEIKGNIFAILASAIVGLAFAFFASKNVSPLKRK